MPSGKDRKEDTWKESDLKKVLKPDDKKRSKDEQGKRSSKERSSQRSDAEKREQKERDDDRKRRGHDDVANGETDHRRRDRERDREKDRERERRKRDDERDKERPRERDRDHDKEKRREKEGRERSKDSERSKDRERRKDRDDGDKERDRDRRMRDPEKTKDGSGHERRERRSERERSKERDGDRDRRKEKSSGDRDRERRKEKEQEKKGEADGHERRKDRDTSRERRKDREREGKVRDTSPDRRREKERVSDKDRDTSRDRRKDRERQDRDRGKERTKDHDRDNDRERRKDRDREKDRERRKERDRDRLERGDKVPDKDERRKSERHSKDSERRSKAERSEERDKEERIKRREKELMDSLKQEEESRKERLKFRSDTIEEADTVDEDVEQKRKASSRKASVVAADEVHDEENNGYGYEDDEFEDYDEDFEDDEEEDEETSVDLQDHSGMQELLQAINAENQDARASSSEGKEDKKDHKESQKEAKVRPSTSSHGRINFVAAKQKQITDQVASRTRRRGQELMHLIDLDVAAFDIFDLPPLNEYELYIKNFGRSDTKQAYVQCNEDNLEKEVQTEEQEVRTKWTQHPASDAAGFGDDEDDLREDLSSLTEKANIDSLRLSKFLQRAAQTCLILLEENVSEQTSTQFKERKDMTCSDGFMQLSTKHLYLEGRPVTCVHISPVQTHFLLIAYGAVTEKGKATSKINSSVQEKGLVCFWNTNEPSEPQRILICESTPMCCCLSPSKATLAFAGLDDGTLVAWDLREPSSMHFASRISAGDSNVILRSPTFSTAGVLKKDESHLSPVVSLLPLVMPGDSARASGGSNMMSGDMLGLSFQLASLEENAVIYLWVVVELERANSAGSESDLGLSPGGKIKLIRSSSISLHSPLRSVISFLS